MSAQNGPSETSPLLGGDGSDHAKPNGIAIQNDTIMDGAAEVDHDPETQESVDPAREAQYQGMPDNLKQVKIILPALSIGIFLAAADQTIIVASYGKIGSELKALNLTSWIATSYYLTLTSFQPLYGKLSDIFGRKPALLFAYTIFGLGSLFCGLARSIEELIAARVFQGIGGGGMTTVVSILLSDMIPLRDRGVWQGILNIIYASGAGAGAPLGGLLVDSIGWRWSFLGQAPLCFLAFLSVFFALHLPTKDTSHWKTKMRRIDFLGALVLVVAVLGLIFGLDRGSNVSWSIPITYGPLIVSVVFFAAFVLVEMKVAAEPFAPGHIIFERGLAACYACNFFSFGGWIASLFYMPLFFQAVNGNTATGAGLRILPAMVTGVSGSLFGGYVMRKTGKYYWLTMIAYFGLTVGVIVIFLLSGTIVNNTTGIVVGMMLSSFGNGIGVTTTLIGLIANAAPEDQAVTTACSYLFRSLGSVVGVSLSATVVQQSLRGRLRVELGDGKDADKIVEGVRQSLDYIKCLNPEVRDLVRQSYGHAVRDGFALMVPMVFLAFLSSLLIREKKLSK